jgi:hypothetical protein
MSPRDEIDGVLVREGFRDVSAEEKSRAAWG